MAVSSQPANRLRQLANRLASRPVRIVPGEDDADAAGDTRAGPARASVALVVRPGDRDLELLLIKRATFAGDPWSGHMALPGGRRSAEDRTSLDTAIREAREEVSVDLARVGEYLGRLDDVEPRSGAPNIVVAPFVFRVPQEVTVRPNAEVALAVWVAVGHLADPASATEYLHELAGGAHLRFPAIGYQGHVIWGITHRIIGQFLDAARLGPEQERTP